LKPTTWRNKTIPVQAGIGLRANHYQEVLETHPKIGWFEVHSENYFGEGGLPRHYLWQIRSNYPLSLHGVGLSLGSTDDLNKTHLAKLKGLIDDVAPGFVSEHLCWSSIEGHYLNDLLPLPYTEESLTLLTKHVCQAQDYLNHQLLIENISSYLQFSHSLIPEYEFMTELVKRTGCGILLDVNNLYVNSINHGWDASVYLQSIPKQFVFELHLAGFTENHFDDGSILIDSHNKPISNPVWELYYQAVQIMGQKPTLIEWDKDIPPLAILLEEARIADRILESIDAVIV